MYTYEQRMKAVSMYLSGRYSCNAIIKELGYPSCRQSIINWCGEFHQEGNLHQSYGHMKDELADKMAVWDTFEDARRDIDDWFDYYNHDRYQWQLAKLSPSQYYRFVTAGEYPLPGKPPVIEFSRGAAP